MLRRVVAAGELELRLPDRPEAVGHLRHVALEDAHRHRRRVLEEVVRPRERVRVEGVGGGPDRGAAGRVDHPHVRAAAAGDALAVAPLQVLEARQQLRRAPQPLLVDRPAAARRLHAPGDAGERQVAVPGVADDLRHRRRVGEVEIGDQLHLDVPLEIRDELRELADVLRHPRLHQRFDRRREQVDDGLLGATQAGAVAAREGQVVRLVEQQGLERADALLEVVDPAVLLRRVRQVEPEVPVLAQLLHRGVGLADRAQGVVLADLDALHAALAGVGIDGDRQQPARARLALFGHREVGPRERELEAVELLAEDLHLLAQGLALLALERARRERLVDRLFEQVGDRIGRLRGVEEQAEVPFDHPHRLGQVLELPAVLAGALHDRVEDGADFAHQPGNGGVGADGVALAAGGAVLGDPVGVIEPDRGHVAEERRRGRHHAEADERVGDAVVAHAAGVEAPGLLPEAMHVGDRRLALRQVADHHRNLRLAAGDTVTGDRNGDRAVRHRADLVEAALDDAHVVLDHRAPPWRRTCAAAGRGSP